MKAKGAQATLPADLARYTPVNRAQVRFAQSGQLFGYRVHRASHLMHGFGCKIQPHNHRAPQSLDRRHAARMNKKAVDFAIDRWRQSHKQDTSRHYLIQADYRRKIGAGVHGDDRAGNQKGYR